VNDLVLSHKGALNHNASNRARQIARETGISLAIAQRYSSGFSIKMSE